MRWIESPELLDAGGSKIQYGIAFGDTCFAIGADADGYVRNGCYKRAGNFCACGTVALAVGVAVKRESSGFFAGMGIQGFNPGERDIRVAGPRWPVDSDTSHTEVGRGGVVKPAVGEDVSLRGMFAVGGPSGKGNICS